MDLAGHR